MSFIKHSNDRRPSFIIHAFLYLSRSLDGTFKGEACGVSSPRAEGRNAGFRPRTARSFCFGKRTQNHWRPCVALRVPLPRSRRLGLRNSLRSDSPRPQLGFGTGPQPRPQAPGHGGIRWRGYNYEILHFVQNDSEGKTARGVGTRAGASRFLQINGSTSSTPQASKSRRFRVASCKP